MTAAETLDPSPARAKRLKAATRSLHESLDQALLAHEPFADLERYGRFLAVQHAFHRDIDALHAEPRLLNLLPGLAARRRLPAIESDLADLGLPPSAAGEPLFRQGADVDLGQALGWLYVAEGSKLGAAHLIRLASGLGLSGSFGARHLAAAPEGRGAAWRGFTDALDAVRLAAPDEERVVGGATSAFLRFRALADAAFAAASMERRA